MREKSSDCYLFCDVCQTSLILRSGFAIAEEMRAKLAFQRAHRWCKKAQEGKEVPEDKAELEKLKAWQAEVFKLFAKHSEYFGLTDADFPEDMPQERQGDFVRSFNALTCKSIGHIIGPDNCGKPEHWLCYRCNRLKTEIEASESIEGEK